MLSRTHCDTSDNVFQPSKLPFYICHVRRGIFEKYLSFRLNYTPTRREGAILQSPCNHLVVKDVSAATGRNDFIFDIWLLYGELYSVSPFQVYRTSTSCLPYDLNFLVMSVEIYTNLTQMNEWGYS